jgi:hypothetical protein
MRTDGRPTDKNEFPCVQNLFRCYGVGDSLFPELFLLRNFSRKCFMS